MDSTNAQWNDERGGSRSSTADHQHLGFLVDESVAFLIPRYHPNLIGWIEGLVQLGIRVEILTLRKGGLEDRSLGNTWGIPFRLLSPFRADDPQAFSKLDFPSYFWIRRWLRLHNPTHIVVRTDPGLFSIVCIAASLSLRRRPIFYSQRPRNQQQLKFSQRVGYKLLRLLHAGWITPVDRLVKKRNDDPVPGKVFVPFGAGRLPDNSHDSPSLQKRTFLVVGKFRPRKRLVECVKAFASIDSEKRSGFNLLVAGQCMTNREISYMEDLESTIAALSLEGSCAVLPNLSRQDVLALLGEALVAIVPSINEPASISQIEAIAMGVPVIVTDSNGTAHYVEDTGAGIVVGLSETELVEAMDRCLSEEVLLWREAARRASSTFHACTVGSTILSVLRKSN